jgi:hypothetical protein
MLDFLIFLKEMHRVKHIFNLSVRFHSSLPPKFNPWHDYRAYLDQVKTYINRLNPYVELDLQSAALDWDYILNNENAQAITENIKQRKENEYADIEHIVCRNFVLNDNISRILSYSVLFIVMFKHYFIVLKKKNLIQFKAK